MNLLTDEQVRQFIVDGCIALKPDVDPAVHVKIDEKLRFATEKEFPPGNNVLSRVPEIWQILRAPNIRGALTSLLGPNYYVHPHRAIHTSRPVEEKDVKYDADHNGPPMGKGSMAGSGWHQDAQSPLSRARHHTPKYLIAFYFPHYTSEPMGPTRYQAGSYLFSEPHKPTGVVLPDHVAEGSFLLLHFDTVHAGWPNRTDLARYMIKIVFTRTEYPRIATWQNRFSEWERPESHQAEVNLEPAWEYIWHWMRGEEQKHTNGGMDFDALNSLDEESRMRSVYHTVTEADITKLVDQLRGLADQGMHERSKAVDKEGKTIPRDHVIGTERRWNERAIVFDDAAYALASSGEAAIDPLTELLKETDPWVRINAVFALGEIGPTARKAMHDIVKLLEDPNQQVVRQTLDAIASIGEGMDCALEPMRRLLTASNPHWQDAEVTRGWTGEDQVRLNAAFALLSGINYDNDLEQIEAILGEVLDDPNGYVPAVAVETLTRLGTTSSHATAIRYLQDRRWDDTLLGRQKPF
ncbi:MAG: HEAT repeat domain-containing protein [Gammaproteobacteria bacterium]|nr:HEAT repeat domain-containing protein [Gammaproteobacteria bacterium]